MKIIPIYQTEEIKEASNHCLIRLDSPYGLNTPVYVTRENLYTLGWALLHNFQNCIYINGPTGTGKSSLIQAMCLEQNYKHIASLLDMPYKTPLLLTLEAPAISDPNSLFEKQNFDAKRRIVTEPGTMLELIQTAEKMQATHQPIIYIKELSRTLSLNQNSLLNLISSAPEYKNRTYDITKTHFITDTNLGSSDGGDVYSLEHLDPALSRRFFISLNLNYFNIDVFTLIIRDYLVDVKKIKHPDLDEMINEAVQLAIGIRSARKEENLSYTTDVIFKNIEVFVNMSIAMGGQVDRSYAALACLFKQCDADRNIISGLIEEVYSMTPKAMKSKMAFEQVLF